jgi:hypothetical protein
MGASTRRRRRWTPATSVAHHRFSPAPNDPGERLHPPPRRTLALASGRKRGAARKHRPQWYPGGRSFASSERRNWFSVAVVPRNSIPPHSLAPKQSSSSMAGLAEVRIVERRCK